MPRSFFCSHISNHICKEPLCFEAILQKLFTDYGLTMNFEQYVLVGSTVRSYLAWLKDIGRLNGLFENNMLNTFACKDFTISSVFR